MDYTIKSAARKEKVLLPGSEEHFVEFREFNRPGRDEFDRAKQLGPGREFIDIVLRYGISDYLLPGDKGNLRYTGTQDDFVLVYDLMGEELEDWIVRNVLRVNSVKRRDGSIFGAETEAGDDLGNSGSSASSPAASSADSEQASSEPTFPASAPS